jgi:hypothetical protein
VRSEASYCRIRIGKDEALRRFAVCHRLPEIGPLELVTTDNPDALAYRSKEFRDAVFVSEVCGWTLFNDLTGTFASRLTAEWLELAGQDDLVFAAYNFGVPYAEVVVVSRVVVVRKFVFFGMGWYKNADMGKLDTPHEPFRGCDEVAGFVADDELRFSNTGWLWFYDRTAEPGAAPDPLRE